MAAGAGDGTPAVSVIVPVYRHWDLVPGLLAALAAQDFRDFEILLVDNAPHEGRPELALPGNARVLACAAPGSYAARNAALATARGRLLAFTDADCLPDPGWLAALVAAAGPETGTETGTERLLAGPVRMTTLGPSPSRWEAYDLIRGIPQARYVRLGYAATANLAVPASVFARLGGFDEGRLSGGDAAFCRRAGAAGIPIALVEGAVVAHPARASWEELARKARRVKGGQIRGGSRLSRLVWLVRTLTPPVRAHRRFLAAPRPRSERRAAIAALYRLWGVELAETFRLLCGGLPERR
ncbi:glycosyltransferase [Amaricoccus sp.]|uniref:glycosyltransferase family 2 protein n=1 Tax=Amaricoccus sp. TaxID=1872485 RepID=UPI001B4ACA62|nr:glycosyltransferase [Amaricoccus sp.]MBP7003012.1 glycosyltransferase family 2 protein [Amaricoccus sp.]